MYYMGTWTLRVGPSVTYPAPHEATGLTALDAREKLGKFLEPC